MRSRAKNKAAAAETPAEAAPCAPAETDVPVTLILHEGQDASALLAALPAGSEVMPPAGGDGAPALAREDLHLCATGAPKGRYVLFAGAGEWHPAAAEDLCKCLPEREEELILFPSAAAKQRGEARCTFLSALPHEKFADGFAPRRFGCALSQALYARVAPYFGGLPAEFAAVWLGSVFCQSAAVAEGRFFLQTEKPADPPSVQALTESFNACKGQLSAARYRFAFDYACARVVYAFAELANAGDARGAAALDEYLRGENMALRVAAEDRAPLRFLTLLKKRGFCTTLPARPGILLALAEGRRR